MSYYLCFSHTVGLDYQGNRYESNRMLSSVEAMIDGYKRVESPVIKLYERDHKSLSEIPSGDGSWGSRLGVTGLHVLQQERTK
jgi:hypothetical protein